MLLPRRGPSWIGVHWILCGDPWRPVWSVAYTGWPAKWSRGRPGSFAAHTRAGASVCDQLLRQHILISRYLKRWKSHKKIVAMSMAMLTVATKTRGRLPTLVDILESWSITGSACGRREREVKICGPCDRLSFEMEKGGLLFLRCTWCITPVIVLISDVTSYS
jgi:hypothetical protein